MGFRNPDFDQGKSYRILLSRISTKATDMTLEANELAFIIGSIIKLLCQEGYIIPQLPCRTSDLSGYRWVLELLNHANPC
jgi:hypothetical protein